MGKYFGSEPGGDGWKRSDDIIITETGDWFIWERKLPGFTNYKISKDGYEPIKANYWLSYYEKYNTMVFRGDYVLLVLNRLDLLECFCESIGIDFEKEISRLSKFIKKPE